MRLLINFFALILLFSFINSSEIYSQSNLSPDQIKSQKDSLAAYKNKLRKLIDSLRSDLDTLTKQRDYLDEKIKSEYEKIYISKYGKEDGTMVANGRIWKGMTENMLKDSWGKPDKVNTDKFNYGTFTQYTYGDITFFFRDKILIDWEDKGKK